MNDPQTPKERIVVRGQCNDFRGTGDSQRLERTPPPGVWAHVMAALKRTDPQKGLKRPPPPPPAREPIALPPRQTRGGGTVYGRSTTSLPPPPRPSRV